MSLILALFTALLPHDSHAEFCQSYSSYTALLTPDRQGAYVTLDGRQFVRELTTTELSDLSQLRKHMDDARVSCD